MKVILLAGGLGSRLAEETARVPKPMVEIGGRPILLHIMDIYAAHGFTEFVVACGYKCSIIKSFFSEFYLSNNDYTISLASGVRRLVPTRHVDWEVSVVDTGESTMTGGRIRRLQSWIGNEPFMVTYGDGVADIDLGALVAFHRAHGGLATVTAVQPPARFGHLELHCDRVVDFTEKVHKHDTWINGGFFVFEPGIFDYLTSDAEPLEREPLANLARDGELFAFRHHGFWHPMDTIRDRNHLHDLCMTGTPPWLRSSKAEQPTETRLEAAV